MRAYARMLRKINTNKKNVIQKPMNSQFAKETPQFYFRFNFVDRSSSFLFFTDMKGFLFRNERQRDYLYFLTALIN